MSEPIHVTRYRSIEGVAVCVCRKCGAALILDHEVDWVTVHDAWHESIDQRILSAALAPTAAPLNA